MNPSRHIRAASRGSALILAIIFSGIIGISLVSYLTMANNSLKLASRSFYSNAAVNLAEVGLELAIARFNELDTSSPGTVWTGWTLDSTPYDATTSPLTPSATQTFTGFDAGPGATGTIRVWVQHYGGSTATVAPKVVAQATVTQLNAPPITKTIEVTLRKRSLLGYGVSAIDDVTVVGGNFQGRSWDSDPEEDGTHVAYSDANNTANLTIGSVSGDISLGGGEVWGYTKVSDSTHSDVGGSVHGLDSTVNDPERRTDDFDASFPMQSAPSYAFNTINSTINTTTEFPLNAGDISVTIPAGLPNAGEQVYVYKFAAAADVNLTGGDVLSITPGKNVIFILENPASVVKVAGTTTTLMSIGLDSSLNIYTNGSVDLTGGGVLNPNLDAKSFVIWGTNTTAGAESIKVAGNGAFTGVIYAPNAAVEVKGGGTNGTVSGAVVGYTVKFNGTTQFQYDEELSELTLGNPYGVSKWKELQTQAERAVYASVLNF